MVGARFFLAVLVWLVPAVAFAAPAKMPGRVVSLNVCTDQYVLALADRRQIAALTWLAGDPALSAAAAQARGVPMIHPDAEQLLALHPDLVIGMPARGSPALAAVPGGEGIATLDLTWPDSLDEVFGQVRAVARALGHPERGEALVAAMGRELAGMPGPGRALVAAYVQRRGFLTGGGTLVDDVMRRVGLVNLATRLGKPALAHVSLEEIVAARPDVLIVETSSASARDEGSAMLRHPALAAIPRLTLPEAWTVCGGPATVWAARSLAGQLARLERDDKKWEPVFVNNRVTTKTRR